MARATTTSDAFNAIAEGARREILEALADGGLVVNDLVERLGLTQPQVSKHLAVLKAVELVTVRADGRQRLYSLNPVAMHPLYAWIAPFKRLWDDRFDRLDLVLADPTSPLLTPPPLNKRSQSNKKREEQS